jgi:YD repeat-containing protein
MKNVLFVMMLCIGFLSCSDDNDEPQNNTPITNLEIPQSNANNPIKAGETITIKGEGFTQSSEIWLRAVIKSADTEVKAEVTSVTASGISFNAPSVSGERSIVLKQLGSEYILGQMYFDNENPEPTIITKRMVKWLSIDGQMQNEFIYDDNGRLQKFNEAGELHEYVYNDKGLLISETRYDSETKEKSSVIVFEYKNATNIIATETEYSSSEKFIQTLTLNEKGQLIKRASDDETNFFEYDEAGNLTKNIESWVEDDKTITQVYTYKYDDKKSYFSNQGLPVWYWVYNAGTGFDCYGGPNNMIEGKKNGEFMESFKFDYDEHGYPTVKYEDEEGKGNFEKQSKFEYFEIK